MHETRQIVRDFSIQEPNAGIIVEAEWEVEVGSLHCFTVYRQRNCEVVGPTVVELRLECIWRASENGHDMDALPFASTPMMAIE